MVLAIFLLPLDFGLKDLVGDSFFLKFLVFWEEKDLCDRCEELIKLQAPSLAKNGLLYLIEGISYGKRLEADVFWSIMGLMLEKQWFLEA